MEAGLTVAGAPAAVAVELYGKGVTIARDSAELLAACEVELPEGEEDRAARRAAQARPPAEQEWDDTAARMRGLVTEALGAVTR